MLSSFSRSAAGDAAIGSTHDEPNATRAEGSTRSSRVLDLTGRAVLLATDGSPCSEAAALVAHALAEKHHALIHVVSVVDTRSAPIPPPVDLAFAMTDAALAPSIHAEQEEAIRVALTGTIGQRPAWPIRVTLGTPAGAIVHEAKRSGAALIIVGLRRHGRLDRAVHDETALNVMRHAGCPVLGVTEGTRELPTRVLVAMDFGESSIIAARTAQSIAGESPVLVLAYVAPPPTLDPEEGEAVVHDLGVRAAFERVQTDLGDDGIRFDHVVLHQALQRTTAQSLLEYADAMRSDLLAAGSIRRGRFDRWLMGSVSTDLVRDGSRSVLITPPARTGAD
jgi:nucleotide-binding universal stress UspA family protein